MSDPTRTDPVAALRAVANGIERGDAEVIESELPEMRLGEDSVEIQLRWDR